MKKVSLILLVKRIDPALKSSINSVLNQDYSDQHIQIILLLGNPVPGLNQLLKEITKPTSNIEILKIDGLSEIEAINKAVMESQGDYFILINPRICYPNNYISHSIELIEKHHADNIGAKWKVISSGNSLVKESIAILLGSNFVIGNTPYKVKTSKTTITSQLFNACYRKRSINTYGNFNEKVNMFYEHEWSEVVLSKGGKSILVPEIELTYIAPDNLKELFSLFDQSGWYKVLELKETGKNPSIRQVLPAIGLIYFIFTGILAYINPLMVLLFITAFMLYLMAIIWESFGLSIVNEKARLTLMLSVFFPIAHIFYAIGSIKAYFYVLSQKRK